MPFLNRLQKLQKLIADNSCDAIVVEDQLNISYLTGLNLSAGKLLVHTKGAHLIVDNRYFELCQKTSPVPVLKESLATFEMRLASPDFTFIKNLAFDAETITYSSFRAMEKCAHDVFVNSDGKRQLTLIPLNNPIKQLRMIKDIVEIEILKEAAELGSKGFDFICTLLREGISESELALELEIFWKKAGSKTLAFDPIIAFGANSSMPHYQVGNEKLKKGYVVLMDVGVNYRNYHSDMTRVVFYGDPDPKLLKIYEIVQKAQAAALALCKPGTRIGDLDASARDYITAQGYGNQFTHSLGHGVGLEIHELPILRNQPPHSDQHLEAGMVITIEPGIYLPGVGGVRIEDTVVITPTGHEDLTKRSHDPIFIK